MRAEPQTVVISAVVIWDAGSLRIGEYEAIMESQREVRRTTDQMLSQYF